MDHYLLQCALVLAALGRPVGFPVGVRVGVAHAESPFVDVRRSQLLLGRRRVYGALPRQIALPHPTVLVHGAVDRAMDKYSRVWQRDLAWQSAVNAAAAQQQLTAAHIDKGRLRVGDSDTDSDRESDRTTKGGKYQGAL